MHIILWEKGANFILLLIIETLETHALLPSESNGFSGDHLERHNQSFSTYTVRFCFSLSSSTESCWALGCD